jgi:hypothetical protein
MASRPTVEVDPFTRLLQEQGTARGLLSEILTHREGPEIRVKRYGMDALDGITRWAATESGFIQSCTETDGERTVLAACQKPLVDDTDPLKKVKKSRQIGFSFCRALKGVAKGHLRPRNTHIFTSLNYEEAREKIRYAKEAWSSLPEEVRLPLVTDNKMELEWANGSRILCMFKPRGKGPADVDLDEFAHYPQERQKSVYRAALFIISRGGELCLGTTVQAPVGRCYDILENVGDAYPGFKLYLIPWWQSPALCTNVEEATRLAPDMPTQERVERYATQQILLLYNNSPLEDFQQECELVYMDEASAFFPWELITEISDGEMEQGVDIFDSYSSLAEVVGKRQGLLYAGLDLGRRKDTSELTIIEKQGTRYTERLYKTWDKVPFEAQEADLMDCMDKLPGLVRLCIDETGLGMELAERMVKKYRTRVEPVHFGSRVEGHAIKERLAVNLRMMMEHRDLVIHANRERMAQIHSIKKMASPSGAVRFDCERNEKHHADKAWSLALACWAGAMNGPEVPEMKHVGHGKSKRVAGELVW